MSGTAQLVLVGAIVAAAAAYVARQLWRGTAAARRKRAEGCGDGCGCGHD